MEYHPRINIEDNKLLERKIILGSFPTWALTAPDLSKNETEIEKEVQRNKNGDVLFFYGSNINKFWLWYREHIDSCITKTNIESINRSLRKNKIGLTDAILQCKRKNKAPLDKDLSERLYNHEFFKYPRKSQTLKILCTSKGVMNEMLLTKTFFSKHEVLKANEKKSEKYQLKILSKIGGDSTIVRKPFFRHIECEKGGTIECLAIPSPGSPYRDLTAYGFSNSNANQYLQEYLKEAFRWFKT